MLRTESILFQRLIIGLAQGLALFLVYQAFDHKVWPATDAYVLFPLVFVLLFVPIVATVSLGNVRPQTLRKWLLFLVVAIAAIVVYLVYKHDDVTRIMEWKETTRGLDNALFGLFFFLAAAIFIGHTLLTTADSKTLSFYPGHFDLGWKHAIQVVAAILFALAFWLLLFLGQALFKLVGLDPFKYFIQRTWFVIPVTALVVSASLHITDVRPAIIAGIRTLALTLLSWLLPIITLITVGFLLVLPFTGLSLLWDTGRASAVLMSVATVLIILINAVYQDGTPEHTPSKVLRYATNAAALALTPLTLITVFALFLRINQYGWTVDRVLAVTYAALMAGYAAGYAWTVLRRGPWVTFIERCNVVMALATIAAIVLLFSPVADPERIAVSSQVSRLASGKIAPDKFDVLFLRFDTGRYGPAALVQLRDTGKLDDALRERVEAALKASRRWSPELAEQMIVPKNIAVLPQGKVLPESFVQQNWGTVHAPNSHLMPECMRYPNKTCRALIIDLDADGADEVAIIAPDAYSPVFKHGADGLWSAVGDISPRIACDNVTEDLLQGQIQAVASEWRDVIVAERRFTFRLDRDRQKCE